MNPEPDMMDTDEYALPGGLKETQTPDPISTLAEVDSAGRSDIGLRPTNQDCFLIARAERTLQAISTNLPSGEIPERFGEVAFGFFVADGVGGQGGGDVASRLAVGVLVNLLLNSPAWIMRVGEPEANQILNKITRRYRQVDAAITEAAAADLALAKMGTTLTLACSIGEELFLGHVGDSRAYLLRDGALIRLTRDHTFAQDLADQGFIRQDEVSSHRLRHYLTKALSWREGEISADVVRVGLKNGDQLLLCTDGLTEVVPDERINSILTGAKSPAEACDALIDSTLANGGKDNVTAIVAHYRFHFGIRSVS
jgi:protein phosphatase